MPNRLPHYLLFVFMLSGVILARLFYWQVISRDRLQVAAISQRAAAQVVQPHRGKLLASDGFALATNQPDFVLYAYRPQLQTDPAEISRLLAPLVLDPNPRDATEAAKPLPERLLATEDYLYGQLTQSSSKWVPLARHLSLETKKTITQLNLAGLGFDEYSLRYYPEASMSAHVLGFVGRNQEGEPTGYFGLEGYYDLELRGRAGIVQQDKDATGNPILIGLFKKRPERTGRNLQTHINRQLQNLAETALKQGLEQYQAASGEIIIMDPYTGAVLAMSALPGYDPAYFFESDPSLYKNPSIANFYEPGSTFKIMVMAAGIESGVITPQTRCDLPCAGPAQIGKYTIRTWNNQYNPGQTMGEVLERSDNTGMIYLANLLGKDRFVHYLTQFGFGQLTRIDLQEEATPKLRASWGDIDLATASFGQGIAVTGIQMLSAVSAIANGGTLYQPQVVAAVVGSQTVPIEPKPVRRVVSPETAATMKDMLVDSAHHGEAQWAVLKRYRVAGKTGTAQIPIAGHYDAEKTIASFIGFAPADNPKFAMLVKLREPQSSPWAAETAAPLWFTLANQLLLHLNVPPEN